MSASSRTYSHSPSSIHSAVPIHTDNKLAEIAVTEDSNKLTFCAGEPERVFWGGGNFLYLDLRGACAHVFWKYSLTPWSDRQVSVPSIWLISNGKVW